MHLVSCTNTHCDVTDLVNHGMVKKLSFGSGGSLERCPGWNIFRDLINEGCGIKINKQGGMSIRDLRVVEI